MPKSGKVLLLDARLSIRKAFFALVFNSVRAALVWHAPTSSNIGLITISDFINMLIAAYDSKWVRRSIMRSMKNLFFFIVLVNVDFLNHSYLLGMIMLGQPMKGIKCRASFRIAICELSHTTDERCEPYPMKAKGNARID